MQNIRGAADVGAIQISGQTEATITVDRERLARHGLSVNDVNTVIQSALAPSPVNSFYDGDRRFDVTLRFDERFRDAVDDLSVLQVALPGGQGTIALADVAWRPNDNEMLNIEFKDYDWTKWKNH